MTLGKYVWSVWKLWRGVWKNSTLPATNLLFGHLFFFIRAETRFAGGIESGPLCVYFS